MTRIFIIMLMCIGVASTFTGCIGTTSKSYEMAEANNTILKYEYLNGDSAKLKNALLEAFSARGWTVTENKNNSVVARISQKGQCAIADVSISDKTLVFETKGSIADGKPYVPIRYIDFIMKSVRKNLH